MRYLTTVIALLFVSAMFSTTLTAQKLHYVQGDVLVHLSTLPNGQTVKAWAASQTDEAGNSLNLKLEEVLSEYVGAYRLTFDYQHTNERKVMAALRRKPEVINAQFNHFVSNRSTIPDDPEFLNQWQYINTGQGGGTVGADIDMDLAWDFATGGLTAYGDTIVVCIIDDGIDDDHPDIIDNLWVNYAEIPDNGIDDDNNGYVDDYHGWDTASNTDNVNDGGGHGTPVTGIVGATGNNGVGVAGVSWNVKLMVVQGGTGVESEVLQAYGYPMDFRRLYNETNGDKGAFVVSTNASWGVDEGDPEESPLWCAFYDSLGVQGILSCGATANREFDIDETGDLPTACSSDYLISVTNMNRNDEKVFGAGYGLTTIDLGAFGAGTWTTSAGGGYGSFGGTSGATPHVTGAIGLMYSLDCAGLMDIVRADPGSAALLVREAIMEGVDPNESLEGRTVTGGRLNVANSMEILSGFCGGCVAPFRGEVVADNDTLAVLTFAAFDTLSLTDVRIRAVGAMEWDTLLNITSPLEFTGLEGCQEYEYQFRAACDTLISDFGRSNNFVTEGCCVNPEIRSLEFIEDTVAVLNYNSVYAAESYNVQLRIAGTEEWTTLNVNETSVTFADLEFCAEYQYRLQLVCTEASPEYSDINTFFTNGCGPCTDLDYCTPYDLIVSDEWIGSVVVGNLGNLSEFGENGYQDFTRNGPTAEFSAYQNYQVILTPQFSGSPFNEGWAIFIDLDQDGDFDDAGEKVFGSENLGSNTVIGQLSIPEDARTGFTRMRVFMKFDSQINDACEDEDNFTDYGEVEDYCITIVEPAPCPVPEGVSVDPVFNFTDSTMHVAWTEMDGVDDYLISYRNLDSTDVFNVFVEGANDITLTNLVNCGSYEVAVQSRCFTDYNSAFSPAVTLMNDCLSSVPNVLNELQEWTVYPNPTNGTMNLAYQLDRQLNDLVLQVYDQLGRKVMNRNLSAASAGNETIDLSQLRSGIYYFQLASRNGMSEAKRVVRF